MAVPQPITYESLGAEVDPLIGRMINDRYKVIEPIGHGGMGKVYKALQTPLDRVVALKVLGAGHDRDPNFYKRFFLEASVTAKLTHPNSITIFDYGRTDEGVLYIAMEFVNGRTLHQEIYGKGHIQAPQALHIARQVCRAIREAHLQGIVHRDLKPANVMLVRHGDDEDFVKVLDFGLVKFFGETPNKDAQDVELTQAGVFVGSPTYMAPEQARNHADPRSDIYSLGVILYHMLAGRPPFQAPAPVDIILKHVNDPPPPFHPALQISPELNAVVMKALAKVPESRFQSMEAFLEALKRCDNASPSGVGPSLPSALLPNALQPPPLPTREEATSIAVTGSMVGQLSVAIPIDVAEPGSAKATWKTATPVVLGGMAIGALAMVAFGRPAKEVAPPLSAAQGTVLSAVAHEAPGALTPLHVESTPAGAEVRSGAKLLGVTPLDLAVRPGDVSSLVLSASGYAPLTVVPELKQGQLVATAQLVAVPRVELPRTPPATGVKPAAPAGTRPAGYKDDPY